MNTSEKAQLTVGFLLIVLSVIIAYNSPATEYESSIYLSTPLVVWIGIGIALLIGICLSFLPSVGRATRRTAYILSLCSLTVIISLPLIRGYYLWAGIDTFSHLGRINDVIDGHSGLLFILYPLTHILTVLQSVVTGSPTRYSLHFTIISFLLMFVVFVALSTRSISNDYLTTGIGLYFGMLFLPVNHISGHIHLQPASQTMLFVPLVLFLLIKVLQQQENRTVALLSIVAFSVVISHPLHGANMLLLLLGIAMASLVHSKVSLEAVARPTRIFHASVVMMLLFWIWVMAVAQERFEQDLSRVIGTVFIDTIAADSARGRGVSLAAIGGSLEQVFLRLFGGAFIVSVLAGLLIVVSLVFLLSTVFRSKPTLGRGLLYDSHTSNRIFGYISIGFITSSALFTLYFLGGISDQYFRHYGFLMGTTTVLGALCLSRVARHISAIRSIRVSSIAVIVIVVILLVATLPALYPSPYIYQDSDHVTEMDLTGYETAFDNRFEDMQYAMLRSDTDRYVHAVIGRLGHDRPTEYTAGTTEDQFAASPIEDPDEDEIEPNQLHEFFDSDTYLAVIDRDEELETEIYNELRYTEENFEYLDNDTEIDRVQSNGGFTLYYVNSSASAEDDLAD